MFRVGEESDACKTNGHPKSREIQGIVHVEYRRRRTETLHLRLRSASVDQSLFLASDPCNLEPQCGPEDEPCGFQGVPRAALDPLRHHRQEEKQFCRATETRHDSVRWPTQNCADRRTAG